LARNLATPYLGREPKVRVATIAQTYVLFVAIEFFVVIKLALILKLNAKLQQS
jgi:hypothetical protein